MRGLLPGDIIAWHGLVRGTLETLLIISVRVGEASYLDVMGIDKHGVLHNLDALDSEENWAWSRISDRS